jgi:hypothetical protein
MGRVGVGFEEVRAYDVVPLGKDRLLGCARLRILHSYGVVVVERNWDCIPVGNERRMIRLVVLVVDWNY